MPPRPTPRSDSTPALISSKTDLRQRLTALGDLLGSLVPVPDAWLTEPHRATDKGKGVQPTPCNNYSTLVGAWQQAMLWTDGLDHGLTVMLASIASTRSVGDQLWIKLIGPAASGKSTLCEAVSTAKKYVLPKSTLRGFHSGYKLDNGENCSLLTKLNGMTLVTKDGDALLQSPNCAQILSEARDVYDSVSRSDYRNNMGMDHEGLRMTWILAGTSSLRAIDESELGERFLDCVIMHAIDEEMEDQVLWHVVRRANRNLGIEANGQPEKQYEPELVVAMGLTGGYVEYLRENAQRSMDQITADNAGMSYIARLGKFVAYMRARPSTRQDEDAERELASRLVSQHMRLAKCLALVLNRSSVDADILKRTKRVALDTARGLGLNIVRQLYKDHLGGLQCRTVSLRLGMDQNMCRKLLQFYRRIGATHSFRPKLGNGAEGPERWKLTDQLKELCDQIIKP